ncbi:MAG: archease [Candidatus Methylomirabilia bacterium]
MTSPEGFEYFGVTADVGVRAWGPTTESAFRQVALGLFALIVELDLVEEREAREVRSQGDTPEALVVNWLNDCLYVHDIEGFLARRIEFTVFEARRLHALLWGEDLDPARHRVRTNVKAATYHGLTVGQTDSAWEIRVVVDI